MSEDASPSKIARQWFEDVWHRRDYSAIDRLLDPCAKGHHEGGLETSGPEDYVKFQNSFLALMPDLRLEIEALLGDEQEACVRWIARGTHTGSGMGFKPTGRPVVIRGMSWLRVVDGLIVEGWDSWNQGDFIASLAGISQKSPV